MTLNKYNEHNYEKLTAAISPALRGEGKEEKVKLLIKRYSCINNILTAEFSELSQLVGESAAVYIKVLSAVTSRRYTEAFEFGKPHSRAEIAEYFKALFLTECVECVCAMLLDDEGIPTSVKLINRGTVSASDVIPRKILETAINGGSHRVILAHNHPHGLAKASEDDIRLTSCVSEVLSMVGIKLEYHLVVAGDESDLVSNFAADIIKDSRQR